MRPIFWAIKPKSYVAQTHTWDDFPNGRWGKISSPAFQFSDNDCFNSFSRYLKGDPQGRRVLWGEEILDVASIATVFTKFVKKEIKKFPFSEGPMTPESQLLQETLIRMN